MRSLGRSIKKFSADDMLVYASALSYQLFFSLFPFVIFLLALLGVLNLTSFFVVEPTPHRPGQDEGKEAGFRPGPSDDAAAGGASDDVRPGLSVDVSLDLPADSANDRSQGVVVPRPTRIDTGAGGTS
jgi:hypothetical protein